jgi:hypothetical protein
VGGTGNPEQFTYTKSNKSFVQVPINSAISLNQLSQVVEAALIIEELFAFPQDIEWGYDNASQRFTTLHNAP